MGEKKKKKKKKKNGCVFHIVLTNENEILNNFR
jgi:hypothetical protein